jgi:hypothetical protein
VTVARQLHHPIDGRRDRDGDALLGHTLPREMPPARPSASRSRNNDSGEVLDLTFACRIPGCRGTEYQIRSIRRINLRQIDRMAF